MTRSFRSPICLIVNADDFGLTDGVSRGILEAHDKGIVTSTTVMISLPISPRILREALRREQMGFGLHLNITFGFPVSDPKKIPSLLNSGGRFKRRAELDWGKTKENELTAEYEAQILRFKKIFGRLPTHLDTHHHLHDLPKANRVLVRLALQYGLPVRQSRLTGKAMRERFTRARLTLTERLWEDLDPKNAWNERSLIQALRKMKPGTHELMCHPARCDEDLRKISSFNHTRERELKALCSRRVLTLVREKKIQLIPFGALARFSR